jgi:transcriptional regulator with XRE-family HTH domain
VAAAPPSKLRRVFAKRVRARRKELGLSQEELADRAEVHRTFVSQLERGLSNVSIDNLGRISDALKVPAWELLRNE